MSNGRPGTTLINTQKHVAAAERHDEAVHVGARKPHSTTGHYNSIKPNFSAMPVSARAHFGDGCDGGEKSERERAGAMMCSSA